MAYCAQMARYHEDSIEFTVGVYKGHECSCRIMEWFWKQFSLHEQYSGDDIFPWNSTVIV